MRDALARLLRCPKCQREPLAIEPGAESTRGELVRGRLRCNGCASTYPILDGVPTLLTETHSRSVQASFTEQWRLRGEGVFERGSNLYGLHAGWRAEMIGGLLGRALDRASPGDWILDAGCGNAQITQELALRFPHQSFVALDFNGQVREAARTFLGQENLHFVQGDVARPPFSPEQFRAVYSYGVVHHTENTARAFRSVAELVSPGGGLMVWIYPPASEAEANSEVEAFWRFLYRTRDIAFARLGHLLPPAVLLWMLRVYLMPSLARRPPPFFVGTRGDWYRALLFTLYDTVSPEYQHRHTRREVLSWFEAAGFEEAKAWSDITPAPLFGCYVGAKLHA